MLRRQEDSHSCRCGRALYDKLIATNPKIERRGANNPYTALNGNMFTLLNPPNGDLAHPAARGRAARSSSRSTKTKIISRLRRGNEGVRRGA